MNAADTSASSAIAPCTLLTVVSRSSTTLEIDTFISEVSTTSTNIAIASSSARRPWTGDCAGSGTAARHQLPQLGGGDHGQAGRDADQPLRTAQLDRVEEPLAELQLGGQDDRDRGQQRRDDEGAVVERVQTEHRAQVLARGEREEQVADGERGQRHRAGKRLPVG